MTTTSGGATEAILERRRAGVREVQRRQLLEGFVAAVTAKGFAAATIADVVRYAHTSKTTFYEHFVDKEAVYLALHDSVRAALEASVGAALARSDSAPLRERVEAVIAAYLRTLTEDPTRLVQVQVQAQVATPAAVAARLESRASFAALIGAALSAPGQPEPSEVAVRLGLAGTTEVVAEAVTAAPTDRVDAVLALRDPLVEVWTRLLAPPASPMPAGALTQPGTPAPPVRPASSDWRPGV